MKDWTAISALAAVIAAVAAIVGVFGLFQQMRQEAALARVTTGVDSLWHLDDRWNSATMTESRRNAAASLLAAHPTTDVDDVLDFFETVGFLVHRQVLDPELAWDAYYSQLAHYWAASETYRQKVREAEGPTTWQELDTLVRDLAAIEARKRGAAPGAPSVVPTPAQTKAFLKDESELPQVH